MARRALGEDYADALREAILTGVHPPGSALPSEGELASAAGLSRLTVREAIKVLRAKGMVRVERGRGTYVTAPAEWSLLDPVLLLARSELSADGDEIGHRLIEARRLVEVGAASLAARRRTDGDLEALESSLAGMREADRAEDVGAFVAEDIRFHTVILDAVGNVFIAALFDPLQQVLRLARWQTSAFAEERTNAIAAHGSILRALAAGDSDAAGQAMGAHIDQTERDFVRFVAAHGRPLSDRPAS